MNPFYSHYLWTKVKMNVLVVSTFNVALVNSSPIPIITPSLMLLAIGLSFVSSCAFIHSHHQQTISRPSFTAIFPEISFPIIDLQIVSPHHQTIALAHTMLYNYLMLWEML
eukprot:87712_1